VLGTSAGEWAGGDARVVDENVEVAVVGVEVGVGCGRRGGLGDVELQQVGIDSGGAEFVEGGLALFQVAGADDDLGYVFQFDRGLKSDAAIAAGDECDLLRHEGSVSPVLNWIRTSCGKVQRTGGRDQRSGVREQGSAA
jgi:hypothetical protein